MKKDNVFDNLESEYKQTLGEVPESVKASIESNIQILGLIGDVIELFTNNIILAANDSIDDSRVSSPEQNI